MAQLAGQITSDHLTCQICQSTYRHPKALPCLHSFCYECLQDYVVSRHNESTEHFPCPLCRNIVEIPEGGIAAYPENHLINSLIDTLQENGTTDQMKNDTRHAPTLTNQVRIPVQRNAYKASIIFGQYGENTGEMKAPSGICFSANNQGRRFLHVSNEFQNKVMTFNSSGQLEGEFFCPYNIKGIASDGKHQLFVACCDDKTPALAISYTPDGRQVEKLGSIFSYELAKKIAVAEDGRLAVVIQSSYTVYVLCPTGKLAHKFGKRGKAADAFLQPTSVAMGISGDIYITDSQCHSVKVFDKFGRTKFAFGEEGSGTGQFNSPTGIAVDYFGNVVVVDSGNFRLQQFTKHGRFVTVLLNNLNRHGFPPGVQPTEVAIHKNLMAILYTGPQFAQVRMYIYEPDNVKNSKKTCFCM